MKLLYFLLLSLFGVAAGFLRKGGKGQPPGYYGPIPQGEKCRFVDSCAEGLQCTCHYNSCQGGVMPIRKLGRFTYEVCYNKMLIRIIFSVCLVSPRFNKIQYYHRVQIQNKKMFFDCYQVTMFSAASVVPDRIVGHLVSFRTGMEKRMCLLRKRHSQLLDRLERQRWWWVDMVHLLVHQRCQWRWCDNIKMNLDISLWVLYAEVIYDNYALIV